MRLFQSLIICLAVWARAITPAVGGDQIILAGGDEAFFVDAAKSATGQIEKLWRWSGTDATDLPDSARREFEHLDECKPVGDGSRILICASNGGCALIERSSRRILWRGHATNAHSLEMLPRGRIVVASSLSGDRLLVFDSAKQGDAIFKTPLHAAHGVVWDESRKSLWALGFEQLQRYELEAWETDHPALILKEEHRVPDHEGHDLRLLSHGSHLVITTELGVYLFDCAAHRFSPHEAIGTLKDIKSVDIHPKTGRIVFTNWTFVVRLLSPDAEIRFHDARPYKARWLP